MAPIPCCPYASDVLRRGLENLFAGVHPAPFIPFWRMKPLKVAAIYGKVTYFYFITFSGYRLLAVALPSTVLAIFLLNLLEVYSFFAGKP